MNSILYGRFVLKYLYYVTIAFIFSMTVLRCAGHIIFFLSACVIFIFWLIISNTIRGKLVIKFPASRGRVCGSPDAVGGNFVGNFFFPKKKFRKTTPPRSRAMIQISWRLTPMHSVPKLGPTSSLYTVCYAQLGLGLVNVFNQDMSKCDGKVVNASILITLLALYCGSYGLNTRS